MADDATLRSARGVYGISVTAELSGVDPQTLRLYERRGLITPARTDGGTRRYSDDDVARVARITELVDAGVNLTGIGHILDLQDRNTRLEADNARLSPNADQSAGRQGSGDRNEIRGLRSGAQLPGHSPVHRWNSRAPWRSMTVLTTEKIAP
ncbi:MAG TPA: helix-turn-helix transcriptional regulator [Mycobacterium sp.]|nr:helix-turn-helix transcriptional regulator [Mycobacterium sp.]